MDMLEIYAVFWFEDILVSQKIYAIVYDYPFIAEIEQKSIVFATTICCGVRNPRILETIIDFVTKSYVWRNHQS